MLPLLPSSDFWPATDPFLRVSDAAAIAEILRGNREMFEVIVRRYNARLYRVGMAYLRNHGLVEDAMQEAYLKAFLNLRRYGRTAAFGTWLTRIMINECLMALRRARARPTTPLEPAMQEALAATDPRSESGNHLDQTEMKALLEDAIRALPQNYRAVYMLREVQQLTTVETAECLGISPESVKVMLHRARSRLKTHLLDSVAGAEVFTYAAKFCTPMTERVLAMILQCPLPAP